jgi:hypothetical protein
VCLLPWQRCRITPRSGEDRIRTCGENAEKASLPVEGAAESGAGCESDLLAVVKCWQNLSDSDRATIMTIVNGGKE